MKREKHKKKHRSVYPLTFIYKTNERKQKITFKGILQIHVLFFDIENMFNTLFVICFR